MNKYLDGLIKQFDILVDESGEIFEEEHPWLFNPGMIPQIVTSPRRADNNEQIENVATLIKKEVDRIEALRISKIPPPVQSELPLDK